jgi:hypothetical protein
MINLSGYSDKSFVAETRERATKILELSIKKEEEILLIVMGKIG